MLRVPLVLTLLLASSLTAGDWPQILGPQRTGVAEGEALFAEWPEGGPDVLWSVEAGEGLAGVVVRGDVVALYHRPGVDEALTLYDAKSGEVRWSKSFPSRYRSTISADSGPRCTPVFTERGLVLLSPEGMLRHVSLQNGEPFWEVDCADAYDAPEGYFGFGSTPLVWEGRVLVNVGGRAESSGVVAFDLKTGKELWKAGDERGSYSAPVLLSGEEWTFDGEPTAVFATRLSILGVAAKSGAVRFRVPFGSRGPTVNAASPVLVDPKHLFFTASYNIGSLLLKRTDSNDEPVAEVYRQLEPLASQYTTPLLVGGFLYGVDGRDDGGPVTLTCAEPLTGTVLWNQPVDYGSLVSDGRLAILQSSEAGLTLVELNKAGFRALAEAEVDASSTLALPALSNGRLFVKGEQTLTCLRVGKAKPIAE